MTSSWKTRLMEVEKNNRLNQTLTAYRSKRRMIRA